LLAVAGSQDDFLVLHCKALVILQAQEKEAGLTSLHRFRINTFQESNSLSDALLELREGLLVIGHGDRFDFANANSTSLSCVANALDLS
jgi:hypothetical protein